MDRNAKHNLFIEALGKISNLSYPDRSVKNVEDSLLKHIPNSDSELVEAANKYNYLFTNNPYYRLHQYLFTDNNFSILQKKVLKMHLGMFAFVDPSNDKLRYLYGPCDFNGDKTKTKPHFFFMPYYNSEQGFEVEPFSNYNRILETNYYTRNNHIWSSYSFVDILKSFNEPDIPNISLKERYSQFEKEKKLIYVSGGELESTLLYWSLLHISEVKQLQLLFKNFHEQQEYFFQKIRDFKFEIDFSIGIESNKAIEVYFEKDYNDVLFNNCSYSLFDWLISFGLILSNKPDLCKTQLSERAKRLIKWLAIYVKSLVNKKTSSKKYSLNILGNDSSSYFCNILKNHKKADSKTWLEIQSVENLEIFLSSYQKDGCCFKTLIFAIQLMINSIDSEAKPTDLIQEFTGKCRYNPFLMFNTSYAKRNGVNDYFSRAWIAFSVLEDDNLDLGRELHNTGFFFCTIKDSSDDGNGYFEHFEIQSQLFKEQIIQIKAVANALSRIESREVYYKELYDGRQRSNTYDNLYHNTHFYFDYSLTQLNKLKRELTEGNSLKLESVEFSLKELKNLIDYSRYATNPELFDGNKERMNLTETLEYILKIVEADIIENEGDGLRLRDKGDYLAALQKGITTPFRDEKLFQLTVDNDLFFETYPGLVKIIMKDLITNATRDAIDIDLFKNDKNMKPKVNINLNATKEGILFKISNRCEISREAQLIFDQGYVPSNSSLHNPKGLQIISNYCRFLEFEPKLNFDEYFTEFQILFK